MSTEEKTRLVPKLRFPDFVESEGWTVKPFQNLFTIGSGRDYKHLSKGSIPVYGSGGYMLAVNDFLYDGESVCIGRKGTINNPMFLTGKFWTVDTLFYTHSFQQCLPEFIYAIFQNIEWLKHNEAGGVPSLSKTIIEKIQTAVPEIPEQQKLADCLRSLDELIAAQARKVEALKTHKKGLMQQLFPREGETQPRLRFPEFRDAKEWENIELGQCLEKIIDYRGKPPPKAPSGVPLITAKNVRFGWIDMSADEYIEADAYDAWMTKGIPRAGDILFTTEAPLGNAAMFPSNGRFALGQRIITLRCKTKKCIPEFLFHSLLGPEMQEVIDFHSTGSTAKGIKSSVFVTLSFRLPKVAEQLRIADCLTGLDANINAAGQELDTLKTHKKGLMQQLFPVAEAVAA
jgi:type I restriction enzyme S subunit